MGRLTNKETLKKMDVGKLLFQQNTPEEIYFKLGKLEDVLEKYGIEGAEEFDKIISWLYTLTGRDADNMKFIAQERSDIHDMYKTIKYDRDTWKKACELACHKLSLCGYGCPAQWFYNQAKENLDLTVEDISEINRDEKGDWRCK